MAAGLAALLLMGVMPDLYAEQASFDERWRWTDFTTEAGLPSNNVLRVVETDDSTLWAVCDAGLSWYDGFQWVSVPLPASHLARGTFKVSTLRRDSLLMSLDDVWYAVGRGGVRRLQAPASSRLVHLAADTLLCMWRGKVYFFVHGELRPAPSPSGFRSPTNIDLFRTEGGGIWLETSFGLMRWREDGWRMMFPFAGSASIYLATDNAAGSVLAHFQLPLEQRGLWLVPADGGRAHSIGGSTADISALAISPAGTIIAAYRFGDVRVRSGNSWVSSPELRLRGRNLNSLLFRRNGDLVMATIDGVEYFNVRSARWQTLRMPDASLGAVNEILVTRTGETWLGTAGGLIRYSANGSSKTFTEIRGTRLLAVTGLAEDAEGRVWVSSGGSFDGAWCWNGENWYHYPVIENPDGARFHRIEKDRSGRLWFLGLARVPLDFRAHEPGVFVLEGGRFVNWGRDNGLPNTRVYAFCEDPRGSFWFGTPQGLLRWRDGTWRLWTIQDGLIHNRIYSLACNRRGEIWFAHQAAVGLGCLDTTGSVRYFTTKNGLVNDAVWEVAVDSVDVVWAATRGGLASYRDGVWLRFDRQTGLQSELLWPVLPLGDRVIVGTHGSGAAILDRSESIPPVPRIVIERPVVDGNDVRLAWRAFSFRGVGSPGEILTRYRMDDRTWSGWSKTRDLDVRNLSAGEHTFAVQALGVIGSPPDSAQAVVFTILPPLYLRPVILAPGMALVLSLLGFGYVLVSRKRQYNREVREREARFRAVTETTASAIFIYDRMGIRFMNPSAEALTGYGVETGRPLCMQDLVMEADRAAFLPHCLQDDGSVLSGVRSEIRIIARNGRVRWLDFMSGPIRYGDGQLCLGTAFDVTERKTADERLRSLTSELILTEERERRRVAVFLHDVIGQALALCKIRIRSLQKASSSPAGLEEIFTLVDDSIKNTRSLTFDLYPPVLHELAFPAALRSLVEQLLSGHDLDLEFCDGGAPVALKEEKRLVAYHVVREIVVNSIKHARARTIRLGLGVHDGKMTITVADDGVGLSTPSAGGGGTNGGFGLFNIRERLAGLGGALDIRSDNGRGTVAVVTIPTDEPAPTNIQGATLP